MSRHALVLSALASASTIATGCGGGDTKTVVETVTVPAAVAAATPSPEPTAEPTPGPEVGKTFTSGGIKLRVLSFRTSRSITYNGGTQSDVTPTGEARTIKARQGGRYFFVRTRVENDTKKGIDITCSAPITANAVDEDGRRFDPVEDLFSIRGNPGCNDKLQPGFKATMTWAYLVPAGARVVEFSFLDSTDFDQTLDPAVVRLR